MSVAAIHRPTTWTKVFGSFLPSCQPPALPGKACLLVSYIQGDCVRILASNSRQNPRDTQGVRIRFLDPVNVHDAFGRNAAANIVLQRNCPDPTEEKSGQFWSTTASPNGAPYNADVGTYQQRQPASFSQISSFLREHTRKPWLQTSSPTRLVLFPAYRRTRRIMTKQGDDDFTPPIWYAGSSLSSQGSTQCD